ncbi:hypothetical protein P691DRAFT_631072, partial [Macrolepiota fuliginosa MF-IS2]
SFTLSEFTARASAYCNAGDQDSFIRFVLNGEYIDAFLDPIQNIVANDHPLTVSHDYDSAIGISDDILVDGPITIHTIPHSSHDLTSSIHMKYPITCGNTVTRVDYHRIPNFELGTFGSRHHIHIFFPGLWSEDPNRAHRLTAEQRALWYEHGIRPAIRRLLGEAIVSEWPATYNSERRRAEKNRGGYSWSTKIIERETVLRLAEQIRRELLDDPLLDESDFVWAQGFFVMHTIRGVKHGNFHRADLASAEYYFEAFIKEANLLSDAGARGDWYVDVGIEISSNRSHCLQWMTDAHHHIVQQALRIPEQHAQRITQINSSKYSRDLASHLTAISGFRITPGRQAEGPFKAVYLQAYTTDKSVVYNPEGSHHAKFLSSKEALGQVQPSKTIDALYELYDEAKKMNFSKARLEVRVPYRFATQILLEFDPNVLRNCLCVFTRKEWWDFRLIRIMAISKVLTVQADSNPALRFTPEALTLTAACLWLTNGLHARPEDGPASRKLMDAVLPVTEADGAALNVLAYNTSVRATENADEYSDRKVPYNPYGCIFLRRLKLVNIPRMRYGGPILTGDAFKYWFDGLHNIDQLKAKYLQSGIIDKSVIAVERSTTSKRKPPLYINMSGREEQKLFNLGALGHTLPSPVLDNDSDLEDRPSPPPDNDSRDLDTMLSALWRQFVSDLTSKSPNPHGRTNPSYLKLTDVQRQSGSEDPYQN